MKTITRLQAEEHVTGHRGESVATVAGVILLTVTVAALIIGIALLAAVRR